MNSYGGSLACSAADSHYLIRTTKNAEFCISGRSPFPDVDVFIESIACIEGIPGLSSKMCFYVCHWILTCVEN